MIRIVTAGALLAALGTAPMQCRHDPDPNLRREDDAGDALYSLAQDFRAKGDEESARAHPAIPRRALSVEPARARGARRARRRRVRAEDRRRQVTPLVVLVTDPRYGLEHTAQRHSLGGGSARPGRLLVQLRDKESGEGDSSRPRARSATSRARRARSS